MCVTIYRTKLLGARIQSPTLEFYSVFFDELTFKLKECKK